MNLCFKSLQTHQIHYFFSSPVLGSCFSFSFLSNPQAIHFSLLLVTGFLVLSSCECRNQLLVESFTYQAMSCRAHSASLEDFGGVGDGVTSNTKAFQSAIAHLGQYESDGGGLLYVPAGSWVTGSFNLTSHFTLYLHREAFILGSQVCYQSPSDVSCRFGRYGNRFMPVCTGTQ